MKNFYNKYTPREQYEKFGIRSVHFCPFEDMEYIKNGDIEEINERLEEYATSTIYQGYRYFFKDLKSLKEFCIFADKGIL